MTLAELKELLAFNQIYNPWATVHQDRVMIRQTRIDRRRALQANDLRLFPKAPDPVSRVDFEDSFVPISGVLVL